jgi:hypothetical protein
VKVRLTKKLAERLDGVDVSRNHVGDLLDLPPAKARLLVAEEWAVAEERRREVRQVYLERRHQLSQSLTLGESDEPERRAHALSEAADSGRNFR